MTVRKSLAFSLLDRYAGLALSVTSTMVLARILTPAEVGLYSIAMVLLSIAATLRDLGAGNYLIQVKDLTTDRIRAVWTVQLGTGFVLATLIAAISVPASRFYAEPQMRDVVLLLACNYLVNPFGSITYVWLMREMRYGSVAAMRLTSSAATAIVSVWLAWLGHGAMSLAWGSLAGTIANAAVAVALRPSHHPWLPGIRELRSVLSFGTTLTATSILNTITSGAPEFFLGKMQGLAAAGFYSRANGLLAMFGRLVTDAVYPVALSLFSREARSSRDYSASFVRANSYVTVLSFAFALCVAFLAHPIMRLLYGTQWDAAVPITRWLCAVMAALSPVPLCMAALVGSGQVNRAVVATSISAAATSVAAALGASFGIAALGPLLLAAGLLSMVAWLTVTWRVVGFDPMQFLLTIAHGAFVASLSAIPAAAVYLTLGATPEQSLLAAILGLPGVCLFFVISVSLLRHPLHEEMTRLRSGLKRAASLILKR